jgi:hypothetical protein
MFLLTATATLLKGSIICLSLTATGLSAQGNVNTNTYQSVLMSQGALTEGSRQHPRPKIIRYANHRCCYKHALHSKKARARIATISRLKAYREIVSERCELSSISEVDPLLDLN